MKKALECVEEPPTEKTIVDDIVEEEKLQLVNDQVSRAILEEDSMSTETVSDVTQRDVNTQISSVNIYCESDSRRNADGKQAYPRQT